MAEKVLSMSAVRAATSLGRTSIYDGVAAGTFPKPIKLTARRVGCLDSEISAYIAARASERSIATG
jgi:prophage regulatory protein